MHTDSSQLRSCTSADMHNWSQALKPEEGEANAFASELLMPEVLFKSRLKEKIPSVSHIKELSADFKTSLTASAIQFVKYSLEPCALIASENSGEMRWLWSSMNDLFGGDFQLRKSRRLHPYTCAAEIIKDSAKEKRDSRVPADAWLEGFDIDDRACVTEDSIHCGNLGFVLSLLWIHDDI